MLNPTYLEQLPEPVIDLVSELEKEIIADLTKRIVKGKYNTPSAEWMTYKANQLRLSASAINKIIAKNAKVREKTVRELYTEAVRLALSEDAKVYRYAIKDNIISKSNGAKLNTYFRSIPLNDTFRKGLQNTNGLMRNLTNSMAQAAGDSLIRAMDLAWLEVASGAFTPDEAVFKAVAALAEKGITVVSYTKNKDGKKVVRQDQVDVAVRRAVRTSVNKTAGDMQLDLASEMGCDLVEVTSHLGARPSHAEWQGQVYSISGKNPKYKPFSVTGYGTGDGLCGWNCRHSFYPYFEGLSERASKPSFTAEENLEAYTLSQKQRAYERAIRQSKRELAALDSARQNTDDPALKAKLDRRFEIGSVKLKKREEELDNFCKAHNILKDNSRVRTAGFNKSVSQKSVWTNKNILKYLDNDDIININKIMKGYTKYSEKYPDCGFNYYMINYKLKELGIKRGIALVPKPKHAYILPDEKHKDPYHIMRRMMERHITDDDLESYMKNAKAMFVQWNGERQAFYSPKGTSVITKTDDEWIYKTAWTDKDRDAIDEKIMEVISKYV